MTMPPTEGKNETPECDAALKECRSNPDTPVTNFSHMLKLAISLERKLAKAEADNREHAITQVLVTEIVRGLDAKLAECTKANRELDIENGKLGADNYEAGMELAAAQFKLAEAEKEAARYLRYVACIYAGKSTTFTAYGLGWDRDKESLADFKKRFDESVDAARATETGGER